MLFRCCGADDTRSGTGQGVCFCQCSVDGQPLYVSLTIVKQKAEMLSGSRAQQYNGGGDCWQLAAQVVGRHDDTLYCGHSKSFRRNVLEHVPPNPYESRCILAVVCVR